MTPDVRALSGLRFRGQDGHAESWVVQARDPSGRRALWVRHALRAPRAPDPRREPGRAPSPSVAEVTAIAFDRDAGHVAVRTTVPLEAARFSPRGLDLDVDGCALDARAARGSSASGGRSVSWDLAIGDARVPPVVPLPRALYGMALPATKIVSPVADAGCSGTMRVVRAAGAPEETWDLRGWSAVIGHHWGGDAPELWAWGQASAWDVDGLVVEAVAARVRVGRLPMLSPVVAGVFVRFRGERFDFGPLEGVARHRATISMRRLEVSAQARATRARPRDVSVHFEAYAETDDFVGLHVEEPSAGPGDPTGSLLTSAVGRARLELRLPDRIVTATSPSASIAIGTREEQHGVRMFL